MIEPYFHHKSDHNHKPIKFYVIISTLVCPVWATIAMKNLREPKNSMGFEFSTMGFQIGPKMGQVCPPTSAHHPLGLRLYIAEHW